MPLHHHNSYARVDGLVDCKFSFLDWSDVVIFKRNLLPLFLTNLIPFLTGTTGAVPKRGPNVR